MRIRDIDRNSDQIMHPLDSTRLHPDVYLRHNWAIKIAFDALEREDPRSNSASMRALGDAMNDSKAEVERLFKATKCEWEASFGNTFNIQGWDPKVDVPPEMWHDKIEDLDLERFANMIEQNSQGKWHSQLEMIKWEFRLPYADIRKPMKRLAGDALYHLITGETDQSLRPGKEVTGVVTQNSDFGSKVLVEGKIPGFIPIRSLSNNIVEDPNDVVSPNQTITGIVIEVKKEHMSVNLSLRVDDFRKNPSSWERPSSLTEFDTFFDREAAKKIETDNTRRREQHIEALQSSFSKPGGGVSQPRKGRVTRRACLHPAFINDKEELEKRIREGGASLVGEAFIRPSTKSSDSLAIHWVVKEGGVKVIEVIEQDKETDASIGNKLVVKVRNVRQKPVLSDTLYLRT
jgi:transcription elongation factor SPT6